jgi:serine/threonine protein kinase
MSAIVYKGCIKKMRNGEMIEMDVGVKFAHAYASQTIREDMLKEIEFMKTIGKHPNLLVIVGYVKDLEAPVIATQYCSNGDLLEVLRKHELHFMVKMQLKCL